MTDLRELAERVEALEGPSREVDAEIARAINWCPAGVNAVAWLRHKDAKPAYWFTDSFGMPAYTASLDAAMSLVPDRDRAGVLCHAMQRIQQTGFPNSTFLQRLILEIVAAALRAIASSHMRAALGEPTHGQ